MKSFKEIREKSLTNRDGRLVLTAGATPDRIALISDGLPLIFLSERNINQPKWQKFLVDYCGFDSLVEPETNTKSKYDIPFRKYPQIIVEDMKKRARIYEHQLGIMQELLGNDVNDEDLAEARNNISSIKAIARIKESDNKIDYILRIFEYEKTFQDTILPKELHDDIEKYYSDANLQSSYRGDIRAYLKSLVGDDD